MPVRHDRIQNPPLEVVLQVRDVQTSIRFYRDLLGFELFGEIVRSEERGLVALRLGSSVLKMRYRTAPLRAGVDASLEEPVYGVGFTIRVDNLRELLEECAATGVTIERGETPLPFGVVGTVATIRDPDGNLIELVGGDPPWQPLDVHA